jgi:hypothetical protein
MSGSRYRRKRKIEVDIKQINEKKYKKRRLYLRGGNDGERGG